MIVGGKYEVIGDLGQGGMGVVYQVRHRELGAIFALKLLHPRWSGEADSVERFYREARVIAQLRHPHIVKVFDIGHDINSHYFVMEYIQGRTLKEILTKKGSLPLTQVLDISRQVAQALAYAHSRQPSIIHRDIKPHNILVEDESERVVVMDFGIAKLLSEQQAQHTATGIFIGTLAYCAPEQMRSDLVVDGRTDIFSLGLVMYEMATGHALFGGLSQPEIIGKHLYEINEYCLTFDRHIPETFRRVVKRTVEKDRNRRFATATELLEALDQANEKTPFRLRLRLLQVLLGVMLILLILMVAQIWWPQFSPLVEESLPVLKRSADLTRLDQSAVNPESKAVLEKQMVPQIKSLPDSTSSLKTHSVISPPSTLSVQSRSNVVTPEQSGLPTVQLQPQRSLEEELSSQLNLDSFKRTDQQKIKPDPTMHKEQKNMELDPAQQLEQMLRNNKPP